MATPGPTGTQNPVNQGMDIDHEGKSYLKKPEPFNGNRREVDNFIYTCDLFFEGSSDKDFPTDKQKIIFILSYMSKGEALRWRKNYIETVVKQADGSYTWPTKAVFLTAFKAAFLNKDEKEESIRKLDNITQGNRTAEASERGSTERSLPESYTPTRNPMLLTTPLPRKDGIALPSNSTESTETTYKLSTIDQIDQQDDNRIPQSTNFDKPMDEATQLDQLTTEEIINNHDMI